MAVPSRKNRAVQNMMKIQEANKKKGVKEVEEKKITEEEHQARLKLLKELGLVKG